jgi:hypothetical protein
MRVFEKHRILQANIFRRENGRQVVLRNCFRVREENRIKTRSVHEIQGAAKVGGREEQEEDCDLKGAI